MCPVERDFIERRSLSFHGLTQFIFQDAEAPKTNKKQITLSQERNVFLGTGPNQPIQTSLYVLENGTQFSQEHLGLEVTLGNCDCGLVTTPIGGT